MKRYDISLLPKNFFTGGSFYKKERGVDRGGVGRGGGGRGGGREGGGGGGGGGGDLDQEPPSCDPAAAFKEEALPAVLYLHGQIQIQAITNIFRQIKTKTHKYKY